MSKNKLNTTLFFLQPPSPPYPPHTTEPFITKGGGNVEIGVEHDKKNIKLNCTHI